MDLVQPTDVPRIGLDDDSWTTSLSRDVAQSLLRMCTASGADERTYANVQMLSTPNGSSLYIKSQMFG